LPIRPYLQEDIQPQIKLPVNIQQPVPIATRRFAPVKIDRSYENVLQKTNVLYDGELLPDDMKRTAPVFYELYNLSERVYPTTGILSTFIATCLASMCSSERRQFNLLIGKPTGEGGTLVIDQFSKIPFVAAIFDYTTAAGFLLDYCGKYLKRPGTQLPFKAKYEGKKQKVDTVDCESINNKFFISKGLDRLFHQGKSIMEKVFSFFNPLFEEGYAIYSDSWAGHYEIGSKEVRLKVGLIGICTIEDFENYALKASGWSERIIMGTWLSHELEDKIIIQGINRNFLPEIDLSDKFLEILQHLNPDSPPTNVEDWSEEVAVELDKFTEYCKIVRGEKKGKRAARDATRMLKAIAVLNRRSQIKYSDLALMDAFAATMKRNPKPMGWRIPFQYSLRRWYYKKDEIVKQLYKLFRNWKDEPMYTEEFIEKSINELYTHERQPTQSVLK